MSDLKALLKINIINNLSLNKIFKKQIKSRSVAGIILLGLVICIGTFAFATLYMGMIGSIFNEAGHPELLLLLAVCLCSIMCIFTTAFRANAYLFRTSDFGMLFSMPIKPTTIVIAKMISLYIPNLLFTAVVFLPSTIIYALFASTSLLFWILGLISLFLIPILPLIIGSLIAYLFGFIPIPRKVKNIVSTVVSIVFLSLVLVGSFFEPESEVQIEQFVSGLGETIKKGYYFGYLAFSGLMGNVLHYLLFAGINAILLVGYVWVVAKTFLKANAKNRFESNNRKFESSTLKKTKVASPLKALFLKDLKVYLGIPGYVINTVVGPLMSIVFIIMMCVNVRKLDSASVEELEMFSESLYPLMILTSVAFCTSITTITSSSISLEGKSFWIIKASPVATKDVFNAKLLLNISLVIPVVFIDTIVASIVMELNIIIVLLILLIGIIYTLAGVGLGLLVNVYIHRFDFDNPIKVIKNSKSVFITMVCGLALFCIFFISGLIGSFINVYISLIICLIFSIILCAVVYSILYTKGIDRFKRINA